MHDRTAIELQGVGVRFRIYHERIATLKETVIALLRRQRTVREDFWALRGLDVEIGRGESVGIIGRNGSGKSTLLRVVAGVLPPVEGEIRVRGEVSSLIELGAGFDPELSGADNVHLTGSLLGIGRRQMEDRYGRIVEFAGLGQFIDVAVKNYSAGMTVRLAFSIAIHVDPDILLVDEVIAVGDEAFQGKCFERIRRFREDGKTLLIASHGLDMLASLCDRCLLLDGGRIVADGPPPEVFDRYHRLLASGDGARIGSDAPAPAPREEPAEGAG